MRRDLKELLGAFAFVLGSFILFLLVFEQGLVIPKWLIPLGRMHPLLLHLPIVLILMATVMDFFKPQRAADPSDAYDALSGYMLLAGIITSGITVVMGIFLAAEGGYAPAAVFRHKWTGVFVFYLAWGMHLLKNSSLGSLTVTRFLSVFTAVLVILTGYLGASLTHGDNFFWQPVTTVSAPHDRYDFPAVAQSTLTDLNSDYRVVRPVAVNSPALAVNLYNQREYAPKTLDELKEVRRQVVSLQLSRMPVTDNDLKYVARLENLERLNLNFSDITGKGLETLTSLKRLEYLSLAGTRVTYRDLQKSLPLFERLTFVSVWDTPLSASEMKQLQDAFSYLTVQGNYSEDGGKPIKLNPPRLANKARVFEDSLAVQLFHPIRDVEIRFTTDGTAPDSVASSRFTGMSVVHATTVLKARAYKKGWLSSEPAILYVYRRAHHPDTAILLSRLNRVHTAKGAQTFFDGELGKFNANSPAWANNWGGVIGNDLVLLLRYDSLRLVNSVSLNTLIELETFLFPPSAIEVWGGPSADALHEIGRTSFAMPGDYRKPYIQLSECHFKPAHVRYLKIIAKPVMKLPEWHKRKGKPALLLVDEILVN